MKKSSKLISLILALVLATSCFAGFSAFSASAADEDTRIYFKVPEGIEAWSDVASCFAHVYNVYGDGKLKAITFNTRGERCEFDEEKGLWYFDTATKLYELIDPNGKDVKSNRTYRGLLDGCDYGLIFGINTSKAAVVQTGNVTFSKECLGATVTVTGNLIQNTENSQQMDYEAVYMEADIAAKYGSKASITSVGDIVGEFFPVYQPKEQLVSQFIRSWGVKNTANGVFTLDTFAAKTQELCATFGVEPIAVYQQYESDYAEELADPTSYPDTASLEMVAFFLDVDPNATEPATTEPTTAAPTTTEAPTTEPTTAAPTTEPTTAAPTTEPTLPDPTVTHALGYYGDANKDKYINVADATEIQKAGLGIITLDDVASILADVNGDGRISILDVTYVQKYIAATGYNTALVGQIATGDCVPTV